MTEPFRLRVAYAVVGLGAWVALRLFGLRRAVVRDNLRRSFPDWTPAQLRAVEREFARRQGEIAAEVLYARRIGADELRKRVTIVNPEVLAGAGHPRPMMLLGAHLCNFEWMVQRF